MRVQQILHPTDFSECAQRALQVAVYLAVSHGAALHVFHARVLHAEDPAREGAEVDRVLDDARFHGRAWIEHDPQRSLSLSSAEARDVNAYDALAEQIGTMRPDLVVIGTHGRSGFGRLLLGSLTDKLLRHAPCDVLTVRADAKLPAPGRGFTRLFVPVDFSKPSRRALETAQALAAVHDARLTLGHVVST